MKIQSFAALAAVVLLASAPPAQATTYQVTQLTNNLVYDFDPQISGNNVVWQGDLGAASEIMLYDGVTTISVSNLSTDNRDPQIDGNNVVWHGKDGGGIRQIYLYDGATTTQLSSNSFDENQPQVSGGNVVWRGHDGNDWEIFFYDGVTTTQITNNSVNDQKPQISGDKIVWDDFSNVYLYDGLTTTQLSIGGNNHRDAQISGDKVVWWGNAGGHGVDNEIFLYDGVTTTQLTNNSFDDGAPQISGDNITWKGWDGSDDEIFFHDGVTTTQLTNNSINDWNPQISGDNIVWRSDGLTNGSAASEIHAYDGTTTTQITNNGINDNSPQISGNNIVWQGNTGFYEIFTRTPVSPCIIGDADCNGYVDISGDILPAFTNFTGPGSFGKTRIEGDVHGPLVATESGDPHDGDVDVQDLLTMFGAFTGPAPDGSGLVAADAGDPNIPDLIYDPATGEVTLDVDGSGIIGYVLKNGSNSFAFGAHTQILVGLSTSLSSELSEAAFASSVGANSIGNVFPLGMNLAALTAYLTVNDVSRSLGAPVVPFDLVVLGPAVPEPSTCAMATIGLLGLGLYGWRRKRV